jgi:aerobic C4-dicarboxylate transport protein
MVSADIGNSPAVPLETETSHAGVRKPWYRQQYVYILVAAVLGCLIGWRYPGIGVACKPLGDVFISLLMVTIAPLVFLVVTTGSPCR